MGPADRLVIIGPAAEQDQAAVGTCTIGIDMSRYTRQMTTATDTGTPVDCRQPGRLPGISSTGGDGG
jgi:hypothetical protein